jgi:hypothetical protein
MRFAPEAPLLQGRLLCAGLLPAGLCPGWLLQLSRLTVHN